MISELSKVADVKDVKPTLVENFKSIKPEKELSVKELNAGIKEEFSKASLEKIGSENKTESIMSDKNLDPRHKDCYTTSQQRKEFASTSKGEWSGEVGNSVFRPDKLEALEALKKYGVDGIEYFDGEPDFSKISISTVEIDNMSSERLGPGGNYEQAFNKIAEKWNSEAKFGRTDWTSRMVDEWRRDNEYTPHERSDRKTVDLIPRAPHEECKHFGGVAECKRAEAAENIGGRFDE